MFLTVGKLGMIGMRNPGDFDPLLEAAFYNLEKYMPPKERHILDIGVVRDVHDTLRKTFASVRVLFINLFDSDEMEECRLRPNGMRQRIITKAVEGTSDMRTSEVLIMDIVDKLRKRIPSTFDAEVLEIDGELRKLSTFCKFSRLLEGERLLPYEVDRLLIDMQRGSCGLEMLRNVFNLSAMVQIEEDSKCLTSEHPGYYEKLKEVRKDLADGRKKVDWPFTGEHDDYVAIIPPIYDASCLPQDMEL